MKTAYIRLISDNIHAFTDIKDSGAWRPATMDDIVNDPGTTKEVVYREHRQYRNREAESAKNSFYRPGGTSSEAELERELLRQVGGKPCADTRISPQLAAEYARHQSTSKQELSLESQLLNQMTSTDKANREQLIDEAAIVWSKRR